MQQKHFHIINLTLTTKMIKKKKKILPFIEQILRVKYYTTRKVELIRPSPSPLGAYSLAGETDILQEINEVKTFRNKPKECELEPQM